MVYPTNVRVCTEQNKSYVTTINIYTIDTLANKTIARTTIELDADIFIVLPQDVL
jgi:hypothetical protein